MAKVTITKSTKEQRIARTNAYAESVRKMFDATVEDIIKLKKTLPKLDDGIMYSFDGDNANVQKQVEILLRRLHSASTLAIQKGIKVEWGIANAESDDLIKQAFGQKVLESQQFRAWTSHNESAMNAFVNRTDKGMNLSDRVWNSCRQLRDEMEVAITVGMGSGESAASMSRQIRQCLNDPDLMFRRFRYKAGEEKIFDSVTGEQIGTKPIWGKKWKKRVIDPDTGKTKFIDYDRDSYIPQGAGTNSKGVYKSAAKNAMRVARTETNMAYRRADYERWQNMSFVLGVKVETSNQHPEADICDAMVGEYPKNFYFSGWHPNCFCYATPILISEDEMKKVSDEFVQGRVYQPKGDPIMDTPQGFKDWIHDNSERMQNAKSLPYWVKDNPMFVDAKNGIPLTPEPDSILSLFPDQSKQILPKKTQAEIDAEIDKIMTEKNASTAPGWQGHLATEIDACTSVKEIDKLLVDQGVVKSTKLSTMALEDVKVIAKVAAEMQARFGLDAIDINSYAFRKHGVFMHAHGGYVESNSKYFGAKAISGTKQGTYDSCVTNWRDRHEKSLASMQKAITDYQARAEEYRKKGDVHLSKYYDKEALRIKKEADKLQKMLDTGMSRHNVFLSRETMLRDCYTHETGHTLHDQLTGGLNGRHFRQKDIDEATANALNDEMKAIFRKHKKDGGGWLSEYGYTDWQEFTAESTVLYMYQPEKLPKDVFDWFQKVEKLSTNATKLSGTVQSITRDEAKKIFERREHNREIAAQRHALRPDDYREKLLEKRRLTQDIDKQIAEADKFGYNKTIQEAKKVLQDIRFAKGDTITTEQLKTSYGTLSGAIKKEKQLIHNTAINVSDVAEKYLYNADIKQLKEDIENTSDYLERRTKTRELAKKISVEMKDNKYLSAIIPEVEKWKQQFTSQELHATYDAVKNKIDSLSNVSLQEQKKQLTKELKYVTDSTYLKPHKLHTTWQVAESAYAKELQIVNIKIKTEELIAETNSIKAIMGKSSILKTHVNEIDKLIADGKLAEAEAKIIHAKDIKTTIDKYDSLSGYTTKPGKFTNFMSEAKKWIESGDIALAEKYLAEAEKVKKINEASIASKAKAAAKKKAAQAALQKEINDSIKLAWDDLGMQALNGKIKIPSATEKSIDKAIASGDFKKAQKILKDKFNIDVSDPNNKFRIDAKANQKPESIESFSPDCFTRERKNAAIWNLRAEDANDYFWDHDSVEEWIKFSQGEREALYKYTSGSPYLTEPLRAIDGHHYYYDGYPIAEHIEKMTEALSKCSLKTDAWIKRDDNNWGPEYVFGIRDLDAFKSNPNALVGMTGVDRSFMSCGDCKETYFSCKSVVYNIYVPKGTPAIYAETFSAFGSQKMRFDGRTKPTNVDKDNENEIILQRGAKMRITKAEWNSTDRKWYIDVEVLGFDIKDYELKRDSGGWYCEYK